MITHNILNRHTKEIVGLFFSFLFFISIGDAHAYFTTSQHAITLDDGSGLFLIEYAFGHGKHDVYLPVGGLTNNTSSNTTVGYTVLNDKDEVAEGKIKGVVLSHAKITNEGMYIIPKGKTEKLTLMVVFTPYKSSKEHGSYHLQVTSLPFNFDKEFDLGLTPSELSHYITPSLSL